MFELIWTSPPSKTKKKQLLYSRCWCKNCSMLYDDWTIRPAKELTSTEPRFVIQHQSETRIKTTQVNTCKQNIFDPGYYNCIFQLCTRLSNRLAAEQSPTMMNNMLGVPCPSVQSQQVLCKWPKLLKVVLAHAQNQECSVSVHNLLVWPQCPECL